MKKLIPVGFYREMTDDPEERQEMPSLAEAVSKLPQEQEEKIVAYLLNAVCIGARGCYLDDVLDPSCKVPPLAHIYTDGTYGWPLYVAHYVERYHLRLPPHFVTHMSSMNWQPPAEEQVDVNSLEF
jgi:hypothetical protein